MVHHPVTFPSAAFTSSILQTLETNLGADLLLHFLGKCGVRRYRRVLAGDLTSSRRLGPPIRGADMS